MSEAAWLNIVLYLPLIGIAALVAMPARADAGVRAVSLAAMVLQFVLVAWLYTRFDPSVPGLQFETRLPWIPTWGVYYQIGLDGYNILLVLLTAFLAPLVVAGAFTRSASNRSCFTRWCFCCSSRCSARSSRRIFSSSICSGRRC